MELLLHCCCGPCAMGSLPQLQSLGYETVGLFYNPNIHPYTEFCSRKESFAKLMEEKGCAYTIVDDYPLEMWLGAVADNPAARCQYCYRSRLEFTAKKAAELGLARFSTTLLVSPYQDHEMIKQVGLECAEQYGVEFVDADLRQGFYDGQRLARQAGLYMQKYCGCIYSEKERYLAPKKKRRAE